MSDTSHYNLKTISQLPLLDKDKNDVEFSNFDDIFYKKLNNILSNEVYIETSVNNESYKVKLTDLMEYIARRVVLSANLYVTLSGVPQTITSEKTFENGVNIISNDLNVLIDTKFTNCDVTVTNATGNTKYVNIGSDVVLSVTEYMDGLALSAYWA